MINNMLTVAKMYCINAWTIVLHHMHDLPYLTLDEIVLKRWTCTSNYFYLYDLSTVKENENTKQESNLHKRKNRSLGVEEKADNSGCHI